MEYQKTAEATVNLIGNQISNKITKPKEVHHLIIQKQLQMKMIKKYLKKYIHLQKKYTKLLLI